MTLTCVNCGAVLAEDDASCTACGLSRLESLPPGSAPPAAAPAAVETPEPEPEQPVWEPEPEPEPEQSYWEPEPEQPAWEPEPEQPAWEPEPAPRLEEPPLWQPEPPIWQPVEPAQTEWSTEQQPQPEQHDAYVYGEEEPAPRPGVGTVDAVITLVGAVVAFALGWLVHGELDGTQDWMVLRSVYGIDPVGEFNGHDLLVALLTFSPLAVAAFTASVSRFPVTGFLVAVAGFAALGIDANGPRVVGLASEFDLDRDWVIGVVLLGFALGDLLLAFLRRGALTGLLTGVIAAGATAAYVALYFQRIDWLSIFEQGQVVGLLLAVPAGLVLLAGLVGGVVGGLRRS